MIGIGITVAGLLWMGITYPEMADGKGWKRGAWVGSNGWYVFFGFGVLSLISTFWRDGELIWLIPAAIGGFVAAFVATMLLRSNTQLVALLGPIAAIIWFLSLSPGAMEICTGVVCKSVWG
ncbi:MAG: hypothetical protein J0I69_11300 [Altererythrobacter sp.]|nr:hypothetical protein [Altererythrobacter sp.]OJU60543.1 MAG: hypothetical protein BGO08_10115 [Altererythrobacter sp. 66-12]